ncbi:MAG: hypothetical protein K9H49_04865 [Bacteroidales bacterium]|nr:hypothetical protein [Bacteroidales bacterium]MCF8389148.1 hypothetical protein [Bacteroidales bacterium]
MVLRLSPIVFSLLLLAAHFSRINFLPLTIASVLIIALLFLRKKWIPRFIQLYLIFGFVEWIRITFVYINDRKLVGEDYLRLAIILGVVALFTLLSGLMFGNRVLKDWYFPTEKKLES